MNIRNHLPKLPRSERSLTRWFDASAFAAPAPFTYGNSARNLLFGPGDIDFDLSVLKDTKIKESLTVQFRSEFFNLPNHPNFGNPAANISVPSTVEESSAPAIRARSSSG